LKERYKLNLVTLLHKEGDKHHIRGLMLDEDRLQEEDILVLFGKTKDINRFIEINQ
jgi:trk system potassium uptake protein TrkA